MAHRKHLSQESHVAPEASHKKAAAEHTKKNERHSQREESQKTNKSTYGNSSIKNEHGEY
jgi:hypothetical protein